jgi:dihydrofolate synthase/folylpolyglutamate synthase
VAQGLEQVRLPARFQLIKPRASPAWVLDVAHNPDAARVLARNLRSAEIPGRTYAVCGILADKDAAAIAAILCDSIDAWWCASIDGTRGRSGEDLAQAVRPVVTVSVDAADSVAAACAAAAAAANSRDRIVVFGSFHTVGPALDWLEAAGLLPSAALPEYTAPLRAV